MSAQIEPDENDEGESELVRMLLRGVDFWNHWRAQNSGLEVNLSGLDLGGAELPGANLSGADLRWSYLGRANLAGANLSGAHLDEAILCHANLR